MPSAKVLASLSSIYEPREKSPVETDYIIPRVKIGGPEFREFMFGGADRYKNLSWKCVDMDNYCCAYFSVTGKILVMNGYEFHILFIGYINFLTRSSSFCVQLQVSWPKHKIIIWKGTTFAIMLIHFWIFPKRLGNNCWNFKQLNLVDQSKRIFNDTCFMFLVERDECSW